MAAPTLFISYRRDDSAGHAGRLYDRLVAHFGAERVFRDVDTIAAGADFVHAVHDTLARCQVLLALIGPRWLHAADAQGRQRLAEAGDLVRDEIAAALQRGLRVVPVLLQGAAMPVEADLPGPIAALARHQAVEVRDASFDRDAAHLITLLDPDGRRVPAPRRRRLALALALLAAVLLLAGGAGWYLQSPERARTQLAQMGLAFDADSFVARARERDLSAVRLYLRAGLAADAPDRKGVTAAQQAAAQGQREMLQLLLAHGADAGKALPWAAGHGQAEMVTLLLARRPARDAVDRALFNAAGGRDTAILAALLDAGASADATGGRYANTALVEAAQAHRVDQVRLLLEHGAAPDKAGEYGLTPLLAAVDTGSGAEADEIAQRVQIVSLLLARGANLEGRLRSMVDWQPTPLLLAIDKGSAPMALALIERGADVHARTGYNGGDGRDLSALMWAGRAGMAEVVGALLTRGANVDARNVHGNTALMESAMEHQPDPDCEVLRRLLAAGADVDAVNVNGRNALMLAAWSRGSDLACVRRLLDAGARVDAADKGGRTALMFAAEGGHQEAAGELLRRGADRSRRDRDGRSALHWAGRDEAMRALLAGPARR